MLALLLASGAGLALLAWHMQRRTPPPLQLSFARLLPEPPVSHQAERRFALQLPLRSAGFWLRMLAVLAAVMALTPDIRRAVPTGDQGIGLRIVIDVTNSMALPEAGGTRLDAARAVADAALARLATAGAGDVCAEAVLVGAAAGLPGPVAGLARAVVQPEGGAVATLVAAASGPITDCPLTHVLVLTDTLRPAMDRAADAPLLLWHQIGAPVANTGLRAVSFTPPGLSLGGAAIRLQVSGFGDVPPPDLWLDGPEGRVPVPVQPSPDRDGVWLGEATPDRAGRYVAGLDAGGAYGGDDRVAFDLPQVTGLALDWRRVGLPLPRGARAGGG